MNQALKPRLIRAREICREQGIKQGQLAEALGASQSQISRILAGKGQRQSRLTEEVCLFVEQFNEGVTLDAVRANRELLEALQSVWDGSDAHAKALAVVIKSLSGLQRNRCARQSPRGRKRE